MSLTLSSLSTSISVYTNSRSYLRSCAVRNYHVTVTPLFRVMINLWSRQHSGVVHGMLAIVTRRSLSPERETNEAVVSRGQTFRGKGTSGHYCQHSVIQWNFILVTSRRSVMSKKCNRAMRAMRNWSFIRAGLREGDIKSNEERGKERDKVKAGRTTTKELREINGGKSCSQQRGKGSRIYRQL